MSADLIAFLHFIVDLWANEFSLSLIVKEVRTSPEVCGHGLKFLPDPGHIIVKVSETSKG